MHRRAIIFSMFLSQFMTQNQNNYLQLFQTLCYIICRGVGEVRSKRNPGTLEDQYLRDLLNLIIIYWDASKYFPLLSTIYAQEFSFAIVIQAHQQCDPRNNWYFSQGCWLGGGGWKWVIIPTQAGMPALIQPNPTPDYSSNEFSFETQDDKARTVTRSTGEVRTITHNRLAPRVYVTQAWSYKPALEISLKGFNCEVEKFFKPNGLW